MSHLPKILIYTVKNETNGEWAAKCAETCQGALFPAIFDEFENPALSDPNFDLVAFFQIEHMHDSGGQPHRETLPPF